eukprot:7956177-Ditylum_brightwellii.AAC.1
MAFGDLTDSYTGTLLKPLQGLVQGYRPASAGWELVSTPIINMMRKAGFGLQHWQSIANAVFHI